MQAQNVPPVKIKPNEIKETFYKYGDAAKLVVSEELKKKYNDCTDKGSDGCTKLFTEWSNARLNTIIGTLQQADGYGKHGDKNGSISAYEAYDYLSQQPKSDDAAVHFIEELGQIIQDGGGNQVIARYSPDDDTIAVNPVITGSDFINGLKNHFGALFTNQLPETTNPAWGVWQIDALVDKAAAALSSYTYDVTNLSTLKINGRSPLESSFYKTKSGGMKPSDPGASKEVLRILTENLAHEGDEILARADDVKKATGDPRYDPSNIPAFSLAQTIDGLKDLPRNKLLALLLFAAGSQQIEGNQYRGKGVVGKDLIQTLFNNRSEVVDLAGRLRNSLGWNTQDSAKASR